MQSSSFSFHRFLRLKSEVCAPRGFELRVRYSSHFVKQRQTRPARFETSVLSAKATWGRLSGWTRSALWLLAAVNATKSSDCWIDGGVNITLADRQDLRIVSNLVLLRPERSIGRLRFVLLQVLVVFWLFRSQAL